VRDVVDAQHAVHRAEIERDDPVEACRDLALHAAGDARPAAVGDDRDVRRARPFEHGLDVALAARARDDVRREVEAPVEAAHDVGIGLAPGVRGARVHVARADRAEPRRGRDPRLRQPDVVERDGLAHLAVAGDPQVLLEPGGGGPQLRDRPRVVLVAPPPVLAPPHMRDDRAVSTRVLIFTASIGAGHDLPAEVLATSLRERGAGVNVVDGLRVGGPVARAIVGGASSLETTAGNLAFEAGYLLGTRIAPMRRAGSRFVDLVMGRRFAAYLAEHPADVVVSTYPLTTELLGRMRVSGRLATPVVSAITDLAALHYWAHPGVDLHLVTHPESTAEVREIAGPDTRIAAVHGLTDLRFTEPPERGAARAELELPARGSLVVVSGGGWGVGDLDGAIETALHYTADTIVVLTGSNAKARARLQAAFGDVERVQVWGFTDKMVTLLAAADILIHSTAGLTVLEALMCDCKVISYGWSRGHVRINNRMYEELGMVAVARNRTELAHAIVAALNAPPSAPAVADLPQAADLVLGLVAGEPAHTG
jgi:UDP-N-acetylglucosamine:LPS N-acetylglucosamine transferase